MHQGQLNPILPEVHLAIFLVDLNLEHVLVRITQHDIVINVQNHIP